MRAPAYAPAPRGSAGAWVRGSADGLRHSGRGSADGLRHSGRAQALQAEGPSRVLTSLANPLSGLTRKPSS